MKTWLFQALKMIIGAFIAIELSNLLELKNPVTAGIIVLLSIQPTKKKSINIAIKRSVASILGLLIAFTIFSLLGYHLIFFIASLLVFIPLCFYLHIDEGVVVTAVLMSHIYIGGESSYALNAIYLMAIGVIVALIVNLYMPSNKRKITLEIQEIDACLRDKIANIINEKTEYECQLALKIKKAIKRINEEKDNRLLNYDDINIEYVYMRKTQLRYLNEIEIDLKKVSESEFKEPVIKLLLDIQKGIGKEDMATPLLVELSALRETYKESELPRTRAEFEMRAILYHILYDIESFLIAKVEYHKLIERI